MLNIITFGQNGCRHVNKNNSRALVSVQQNKIFFLFFFLTLGLNSSKYALPFITSSLFMAAAKQYLVW